MSTLGVFEMACRIYTGALVLGLLLGFGIVSAQRAAAHHGNMGIFEHWGHYYRPAVSVPNSALWPYTSHAEGTWTQAGFVQGFCVGGQCPWGSSLCNGAWNGGEIVVCFVPLGSAGLGNRTGNTIPHLNSAGHAHAMQIFICSNCSGTATATGRHRTVNHEYGHAIGLGHIDRNASGQVITGECPGYSVMQANPPTDQTCWHDRDELRWNMYNGHWEG